jgi:hypothetical protein
LARLTKNDLLSILGFGSRSIIFKIGIIITTTIDPKHQVATNTKAAAFRDCPNGAIFLPTLKMGKGFISKCGF